MLKSLHGKLTLALFALLLALAVLFISLTTWLLHRYDLEVQQQANVSLAENVARSALFMLDGKIDNQMLMDCFEELVRLNPNIEAYLVGLDGHIITSSSSDVVRSNLGLEPIRTFLAGAPLPIYGDDPKQSDGRIIFSATPLPDDRAPSAYLYLALQRDASITALQMLRGSLAARLALWTIALVCAVTFLLGLGLFLFLTRRLRRLTRAVEVYRPGSTALEIAPPTAHEGFLNDEVDRLGAVFSQMTQTIEAQLSELRETDTVRRELITNVSHDLRTPLTSLRGYLETLQLKNDTLAQDERERFLEIALRQSERLGVLIHELFELAKLDSGQVTPHVESFSLAELAQDVLAEFQLQADAKGIALKLSMTRDVSVRGDVALLERVLSNLLDNAIRHTPAGGKVALKLRSQGGAVQASVADTGAGIPKSDLPRIFERYYRTSSLDSDLASNSSSDEGSGAGLGLAIAKRILELHESHFEVRSVLGQGTVFSFELNAAK